MVIFPNLAAVDESRPIIQPVINLFQRYNVPLLDVSTLLAGRSPADTMVNALDSHPNEIVNAQVAQHLYRLMLQAGVTASP